MQVLHEINQNLALSELVGMQTEITNPQYRGREMEDPGTPNIPSLDPKWC